jgi:hypothetical protein
MDRPVSCLLARLCVLQDDTPAWGPDGCCRGCAQDAATIAEAMVRACDPPPVRVKRAGGQVWICERAPQPTELAVVGDVVGWLAKDVDTGEVFVVTGLLHVGPFGLDRKTWGEG